MRLDKQELPELARMGVKEVVSQAPENPFTEIRRRTLAVGLFLNQESALDLATAVILRASEDWAIRRYMDMTPLKALYTKFAT